MKTLAEIEAIRQKTYDQIMLNGQDTQDARVVVGMATCGIAAGARPVLQQFENEIEKNGLNVAVKQTGCIGVCRLEPIAEVYLKGQEKVTYVYMTPDKVERIVKEHIMGGKPVLEYTIGWAEQNKGQ